MNDPLLDALTAANPVAEDEFSPPPPLRALPRRRHVLARPPRRLRVLVPAVAAVLALVIALAPTHAPGGAQVLAPAFAQSGGILYWRVSTEPGGESQLWMRVGPAGDVIALRELRADGHESVITEPHGLADPVGAVARERSGPGAPIRTGRGIAYDPTFTSVVDAALRGARGALDLGSAEATTYAGRAAYAVGLPDTPGPPTGDGDPVTVYDVTMWVTRDGGTPLAIRWAHGDHVWRTVTVSAFEPLPDEPRLLDFG
jgi:hypothetical protein